MPDSYFDSVVFLTGIDYIIGGNYVDELFLRWDSDAVFADLFLEIGYSYEKYDLGVATLNNMTRPALYPTLGEPFSPEDMLIDLRSSAMEDLFSEYMLY